jgi:ADP-ribose pyrophosphatase
VHERTLSSRTVFEGKLLTLRVDEIEAADGHHGTREVIEHRGAVGVVAVHEGHIVLVRQYRYATGEVLLEIPAGKVDAGDDPEETAFRELVEEVGLRARRLEHLATYYSSPGFTDELVYLYYADDLVPEAADAQPGEVLEVERVPVAKLEDLLRPGELKDAKTLLGLTLLALRRQH